jgi:high-affinity iron transporter
MTGIASSTFIWFREGLEAWLIIQMALLTVHTTQQKLTILSATIAALLGAVALGYGAHQFVARDFAQIEAWTAIAASGLLFWTAWFCHGASQHFRDIKQHIVSRSSLWVLATIVFLTVFREGAEIVAFLTGLYIAGITAIDIGIGAIIGLSVLILVGYAGASQLKKIPVAKIFSVSRWFFTALAIYFLYYGIHELLE